MSIIPIGVTLAQAALDGLVGPVIFRQRNIGGFVADVTIKEDHEDEVVVTENPVEQGADVTDNAFKVPARLTVEVGYSNSSLNSQGDPNYVQDIYAQFLAMQAARQTIDVVTGKRVYTNMVIVSLHTTTDEKTENALILTVRLREIITVDTQTVSVPPSSNMANPTVTGASQNQGTNQSQYAGGAGGPPTSPTTTPFAYQNAPFSAGFGVGG
jgi:hypothetical protein